MRFLTTILFGAMAMASVSGQAPTSQAADLTAASAAAAELPQLYSLLVSHDEEMLLEYYASGRGPTRLANIKSASKSIIAALVGIAIERGFIPSIDEPIVRWFPELAEDDDARKQTITIENLLTMRSGLASTSGGNYGAWVNSSNWLRYALGRRLVSEPGTSMEYSTGTSHILSAILTKATGQSTRQFANAALGRPAGFTFANWLRDPQGIYFGGNEMQMTPPQMLAVGELFLNRGAIDGRQIVPADWVDRSCVPVTYSAYDRSRLYGLGWWIQDIGGHQACFAWGYGGQYIMFFRELDLVVVVTSNPNVSDERRGYRRQLFALLSSRVLPAVAQSR